MPFSREDELKIAKVVSEALRKLHGRQQGRARWFGTKGGGGQQKFGKLDSDLDGNSPGDTATVSIWALNEAETAWEDTGEDQEKVYAPFILGDDTIDSATRVIIELFTDGKWYVTGAEC